MLSKPTEQAKRVALGLAFGVLVSGSVISGIPAGVSGLSRALSCGNCKMELKRGVPTQFAGVMTDEQKKMFKKALRNRNK